MDPTGAAVSFVSFLPLLLWLAITVLLVIVLIKVWIYVNARQSNDREIIHLLRDIRQRLYMNDRPQNQTTQPLHHEP